MVQSEEDWAHGQCGCQRDLLSSLSHISLGLEQLELARRGAKG